MSNEVVIKSNRSGLRLILDNETPFPELLKIIGEEFRQRESFFKNASQTRHIRSLTADWPNLSAPIFSTPNAISGRHATGEKSI